MLTEEFRGHVLNLAVWVIWPVGPVFWGGAGDRRIAPSVRRTRRGQHRRSCGGDHTTPFDSPARSAVLPGNKRNSAGETTGRGSRNAERTRTRKWEAKMRKSLCAPGLVLRAFVLSTFRDRDRQDDPVAHDFEPLRGFFRKPHSSVGRAISPRSWAWPPSCSYTP